MNNAKTDPYIADGTNDILENHLHLRSRKRLESAEALVTKIKIAEILHDPTYRPTFTLDGFRDLHRRIFSDLYPWAGELRTIDFRKGTSVFLRKEQIAEYFALASLDLSSINSTYHKNPERFIESFANTFALVNFVHPFREGNGRTQRLFFQLFAREQGLDLDWRGVDRAMMEAASIEAMHGLNGALQALIAERLRPLPAREQVCERSIETLSR